MRACSPRRRTWSPRPRRSERRAAAALSAAARHEPGAGGAESAAAPRAGWHHREGRAIEPGPRTLLSDRLSASTACSTACSLRCSPATWWAGAGDCHCEPAHVQLKRALWSVGDKRGGLVPIGSKANQGRKERSSCPALWGVVHAAAPEAEAIQRIASAPAARGCCRGTGQRRRTGAWPPLCLAHAANQDLRPANCKLAGCARLCGCNHLLGTAACCLEP